MQTVLLKKWCVGPLGHSALFNNIIYGCPKEKSAKFLECQFVTESSLITMPDIRAEISSFSKQSENVLLLLLRENEDIKSMLKGE